MTGRHLRGSALTRSSPPSHDPWPVDRILDSRLMNSYNAQSWQFMYMHCTLVYTCQMLKFHEENCKMDSSGT